MLLGIRSPGASALVTEDLQHDIGETRLPRLFLGMAIVLGTANGDRANIVARLRQSMTRSQH